MGRNQWGDQDYTKTIEAIEEEVKTLIRSILTPVVNSIQKETKQFTAGIEKQLKKESGPTLLESLNGFYQTNNSFPRIITQETSSFITTKIGYDVNWMRKELGKMLTQLYRVQREYDQYNPAFLQNYLDYWDQINENILYSVKEKLFAAIETQLVAKLKSILNEVTVTQSELNDVTTKMTVDSLTNSVRQWNNEVIERKEILLTELNEINSNVQTELKQVRREIYKSTAAIMQAIRVGENLDKFKYPQKGEGPPFPYVYYFPYPKGPPRASGQTIPKKVDEICPKCGEINIEKRKICKKCGASLIPFS